MRPPIPSDLAAQDRTDLPQHLLRFAACLPIDQLLELIDARGPDAVAALWPLMTTDHLRGLQHRGWRADRFIAVAAVDLPDGPLLDAEALGLAEECITDSRFPDLCSRVHLPADAWDKALTQYWDSRHSIKVFTAAIADLPVASSQAAAAAAELAALAPDNLHIALMRRLKSAATVEEAIAVVDALHAHTTNPGALCIELRFALRQQESSHPGPVPPAGIAILRRTPQLAAADALPARYAPIAAQLLSEAAGGDPDRYLALAQQLLTFAGNLDDLCATAKADA